MHAYCVCVCVCVCVCITAASSGTDTKGGPPCMGKDPRSECRECRDAVFPVPCAHFWD